MRTFDIIPHVGVGPVKLGMTRSEVIASLAEDPDGPVRDGREGFMSGFFVDYDAQGRVEFIELAASPLFRALFHDVCLHETPADEAVSFVRKYGDFDSIVQDRGYSYLFLDLQLSLWRGLLPDPGDPPEVQEGRFFAAIAIAVDGYFKRQNS